MENEKRYNVYIMSDAGKAQALIGGDMNERQADKRVMSGLMRIDRDNFFVADYEVGSEADLEAKKQLTKNNMSNIKERLEYLRQEIEAERISTEEICELQSLASYIEPGDVLLLEWAGVPEFAD